ncbi:MAG: hypothetical protein R3C40_05255 [Parvularculaceae bacterium]
MTRIERSQTGQISARVDIIAVDPDGPLGRTTGEGNAVAVTTGGGGSPPAAAAPGVSRRWRACLPISRAFCAHKPGRQDLNLRTAAA